MRHCPLCGQGIVLTPHLCPVKLMQMAHQRDLDDGLELTANEAIAFADLQAELAFDTAWLKEIGIKWEG